MFEEILSENAISVIESLGTRLEAFYLAGGTGLALQLGHRKSNDFDFFSEKPFNTDAMLALIFPGKVFFASAANYLKQLAKTGVLEVQKVGRENLYLNKELFEVLSK